MTLPTLAAVAVLPIGGILFASVGPGFDWLEMVKAGGVFAICAFVLTRLEPRLRAMEAAIDRLTRSILMTMLEIPHIMEHVKTQSRDMLKELDAAAAARKEPQ